MGQLFCKLEVTETGDPKKPFNVDVFLEGDLIKKMSPVMVDEEFKDELTGKTLTRKVSSLKEIYFWLDTIKKNIAVHDGIFPASKLEKHKVPNLFAKDNT